MALSINQLVNNISQSIDGLIQDFSNSSTNRVVNYYQGDTDFKKVQSQLNQSNWNKLTFPYTFSIVNITSAATDNGGFSDFELPLAPQAIAQKELPAISITPTQGGTTVNHGGLGYKDLSISGTTGIAPFRGEGGVNSKTGEAIFQPKSLKYKSGYEVFIHLRNWFRTYYEFKKKLGVNAKDYRLVFKNYKDGEFLIVELISFEMDRQAGRSLLYDYKLEFKVLSHFEFKTPETENNFLTQADSFIEDATNKIDTARGVFLRTQGILRQVEATYNSSVLEPLRKTTLAMKAFLGISTTAADVSSRSVANTVSTASALGIVAATATAMLATGKTKGPAALSSLESLVDKRKGSLANTFSSTMKDIERTGSQAISGLGALATQMDSGVFPPATITALQEEQDQSLELPRTFYEESAAELDRVRKNAEDFFNLGDAAYDKLFNRTSTLNADSNKITTNDEYDILYAFNQATQAYNLLLSTTSLFKSDFDSRIKDMNNRFNDNIHLVANQAVKQITIETSSLERIAQKELGDSTRWGEIVEVNGLKAPYISEDPNESRDGVLKLGGKILIPVPLQNGFSQVPPGKVNKLTKDMSEMEKSLGVDLKVDSNFDLVLTSSGDFELVAGADNMAQATMLKLSYEPGEVIRHPSIGAGIVPGRKFPNLQDIKDGITNSLLQDNRIQSVDDLALVRDNSALSVSFNLKIKNVDIPIPVKIKV